MFERLGKFVDRHWKVILVVWGLAVVAAMGVVNDWYNRSGLLPFHVQTWRDGAEDGQFAFLPPEVQSLAGEGLLARAFPEDLLKSSVVIVVRRWQNPINADDERFIEEVLKPRIEAIRDELIEKPADRLEVRTFKNPEAGRLLVSQDKEASLIILPLKSEFLEWGNGKIIARIETLLDDELRKERDPENPERSVIPPGLDLKMSGSATVGRDMLVANNESGKATEFWTIVLVFLLLAAIYRAPVLVPIPLLTVFVSVNIAIALIILLTTVPGLNYKVFFGMEVYIKVVVYGTGVDYCLFLIARYKEELDKGLGLPQALSAALTNVGAAVTASACTVICGIGMMVFAQFGKFRDAGIGIALGLTVGLLAALTLTPALLRLAGAAAFWPTGRLERIRAPAGWISGTSLLNRLVRHDFFYKLWEDIGKLVIRRPGTILLTCLLLMFPFAVWGVVNYEYLSYGLLSDLRPTKTSVIGAKAVQEHFPAGYAGPLTILITGDKVDFNSPEGSTMLESAIGRLEDRLGALKIADIRYLKKPLGLHIPPEPGSKVQIAMRKRIESDRAYKFYVSSAPELAGHVTRVDVVFELDPFDRHSILLLNSLGSALKEAISDTVDETRRAIRESDEEPEEIERQLAQCAGFAAAELHFVGPTASIRDLKTVTDHDQIKIDLLVLAAVFVILVILLRKPAISAYLIVSVFFSYFVAIGVTFVVFRWLNPENFGGLDWKVPMFLFTILMAIGEDYNIFLMTRIEEEQRRYGLIEGVRVAMLKTGTIISSCGIIMAGTFMSLLFGSLVGLKQLGFALAFGVLLDTFVVRPLLVPAYLILLYQGRFGPLSRFLGGSGLPDPPRHAKIRAHADV